MYLRGDAEAWGENVSVSWVLIYPHGCTRTMCSYLCSKTESGTICQLVPTTTNNKRTTTSPFNVFPPSQPDHPRHLAPPTTLVDHPQPPKNDAATARHQPQQENERRPHQRNATTTVTTHGHRQHSSMAVLYTPTAFPMDSDGLSSDPAISDGSSGQSDGLPSESIGIHWK
jgi:hypothetical protein